MTRVENCWNKSDIRNWILDALSFRDNSEQWIAVESLSRWLSRDDKEEARHKDMVMGE